MPSGKAIAFPPLLESVGCIRHMESLHTLVSRYWLPLGFLVLLTGLFWLPERHNYKVVLNTLLLLPCLLALAHPSLWAAVRRHGLLLGWLLLYLGYFVAVTLVRQQPVAMTYLKWSGMVLLFVVGAGLGLRLAQERLQQLLQLGVWVAVGAILYACWRDWGLMQGQGEHYRLVGYGALYNPLRSGHLFGFFTVVAVWSAWLQRSRPFWLAAYGVAALTCLAAVVLSGSRAPLLALACVAGIMAVLVAPRRWRGWLLLALMVTAGLILLGFSERLLLRGFSYRPDVWMEALRLSVPTLWLGAGMGEVLQIRLIDEVTWTDPHNVFLAALYRGGLVGLALFLLLFGTALARQYRHRAASPLIGLALALQLFGLLTLQFDGGSLIGRPTEFWHLYWVPMVLYLQGVYNSSDPAPASAQHTALEDSHELRTMSAGRLGLPR